MTLQDKLDNLRDDFENGRFPLKPTPAQLATMANATETLIKSGQADRALKVGDKAPEFSLTDPDGNIYNSCDLLANGPLVFTFSLHEVVTDADDNVLTGLTVDDIRPIHPSTYSMMSLSAVPTIVVAGNRRSRRNLSAAGTALRGQGYCAETSAEDTVMKSKELGKPPGESAHRECFPADCEDTFAAMSRFARSTKSAGIAERKLARSGVQSAKRKYDFLQLTDAEGCDNCHG